MKKILLASLNKLNSALPNQRGISINNVNDISKEILLPSEIIDLYLLNLQSLTGNSNGKQIVNSNLSHLGGCRVSINPRSYSPFLWHSIIYLVKPTSFVDIGAGLGYCVDFFHSNGIFSRGIEGSTDTILESCNKQLLLLNDYTVSSALTSEVDLIYSQEFVEHIPENKSPYFLDDFSQAKYLFITHGLPFQKGNNHVNCRSSKYWIDLLESRGFHFDLNTTIYLRSIAKFEGKCSSMLINLPHRKWAEKTGLFFRK